MPIVLHASAAFRLGKSMLRALLEIVLVVVLATSWPGHATAQDGELARASALNQQVIQLYHAGRYGEAVPVAAEVLTIREKALGPEHPRVAASLNNLADLYWAQGRYAEAEPLYKRSLAIQEKALGPDHPDVATNLNILAGLYRNQGRYAEAEPLFKRSLAIREKALGPNHPDVAKSLNNLAELYENQGRYAEAEPLYKRSLAILEQALGPEHLDVATSLNNLALLYRNQGRYAEAESPYRRSLEIREKALGPDHPDVAQSLNNLAVRFKNQGRYAEAEPLYKRSLAIWEKALGPEHPEVATSLNNLALLYGSQGRYIEAEPLYKRSLAIWEKALGPEHPDVAYSLNNLAALYCAQGRYAEAEPLYKRSLAIVEKALGPEHPDVAMSLSNLADLYMTQGRIADALGFSRRAIAILDKRFDEAADRTGAGQAERRSSRSYFLQNVALVSAAREPTAAAESFRVAQLVSASGAAQAVAVMAARFAAGTDALAAIVRERQDLAVRWRALDQAIVKAASQPSEKRDAAIEDTLRKQFTEIDNALDALDARIGREFPAYAELSNPKPVEVAETQALLAPDEAMLVYLVADDETWLWALRHDQVRFYRIDIGGKAMSAEVAALRSRLDPDFNSDLAPFDAKRAFALYDKIIAPAAALLDGAHRLFVVPDGALESLPLDVLVTEAPYAEPDKPADHRDLAWLMRRFAVDVLPSVGSLRALRRFTDTTHAQAPFVGIGNPQLQGTPKTARGIKLARLFRGPMADVAMVRQLSPLPETADELRAVAKALGAGDNDLYLAERASEPLLRKAGLDRYRVIEFATHGLMSGDLKGLAEPALVLTPPAEATPENDGLLTASEIATLKLDADWVVLSACNTAASDGSPDADGLSGLAKAFFYAGARSVLVSHWSVPSQATVKLVTSAFDALAKDPSIGRAEALRRAEMQMLNPKNPPEFAHPMMWAPFVLAGEGGAGR
jgi:CHAT domain-containing protein/Tfp pilus assembly protein PilF